ncbi:M23 family metallopeptidase [Sorangium sp. So ce394]|uniref:M23 family metallopeptidase n=1 Tax=Sorangium sp. So ce394 TaxID=3133310 RepID=UPI003F5C4FB8
MKSIPARSLSLSLLFVITGCGAGGPDLLDSSEGSPDSARSSLSDDALLAAAVDAEEHGDTELALRCYEALGRSPSTWYAWAGVSGLTALHRMLGDFDAARAVTARVRAEQPERAGLMHVWDGDTAAIEGDTARALAAYGAALDEHGVQVAGQQRPIGLVALRQISRVHLGAGDPAAAAAAQRELVRRYPDHRDAELALASAIAFDAMADGALPTSSLPELLHEGGCVEGAPCALASRGLPPPRAASVATELAGLSGLRFALSAEDDALARSVRRATLLRGERERTAVEREASAAACVVPVASDGFMIPLANDHSGYTFMESPDSTGGYHPGLDINGPGGGDADCDLPFVASASGCVTDSSPANWGSATVQSAYALRTWTHQYGHASAIFYSTGAAVAKGASLGYVGRVGAKSCHLHFEIREQDHPNATSADHYNTSSQANVGDWYQDPFPFIAAHRSYAALTRVDEDAFTFSGSWTSVPGVGDEDDLRYAVTTPTSSKTSYARYTVIPSSSRIYQLWAFVPWNHATSARAPVKLYNPSNVAVISGAVNQNIRYDAWVLVGTAALAAGAAYSLEVASNTGESGRKVAVDDFLIVGL